MLSRVLFFGRSRVASAGIQSILKIPNNLKHSSSNTEDASLKRPPFLCRSTILVQDGSLVHEVPVIVRKVSDPSILWKRCTTPQPAKLKAQSYTAVREDHFPKIKDSGTSNLTGKKANRRTGGVCRGRKRIDIETDEGTAILFGSDLEFLKQADVDQLLEGLDSCYTPRGVFTLLETIIVDEINSMVALQALKKIIELESAPRSRTRLSPTSRNRDVVLGQIVEMIAGSQDNDVLLEAFALLARDVVSPTTNEFRSRLCDEISSRVADDELTAAQIAEAVITLGRFNSSDYQDAVDSLWVGLAARETELTSETLLSLFTALPHFKKSRRLVLAILERALNRLLDRINGKQISGILNALAKASINSSASLAAVNRWAASPGKNIAEEDLLDLVRAWTATGNVDPSVEVVLERHVSRGRGINEPTLVGAIMSYCGGLRIRNTRILGGCAEYLARNGRRLPAATLAPIFGPFGTLDFRPGVEITGRFWKSLEEAVAAKFGQIKPEEVIDILLSCVCLERYPLRLVSRVFRSQFLERLLRCGNTESVERVKSKLKLFDAAMTLECPRYAGPMIPRDSQSSVTDFQDQRIASILDKIYEELEKISGGDNRVSKNVSFGQMPNNELYTLDALVHPREGQSPQYNLNLDSKKLTKNSQTAVLVHVPEHFCRDTTKHLTGFQSMRKRHLRKFGLSVVTLEYETLERIETDPAAIAKYLKDRFSNLEKAL
ncbi:FAST kinase domain-containing protein 4-like [Athalia rosae]|uniref:FAST kinase domain-containing protein 4-like n=1 Tax=Athalia rosae TaxID=37344 RepID=UPI0020332F2A|nr:FAST kinase domain-containing protein 4-like [Athalia rosae]